MKIHHCLFLAFEAIQIRRMLGTDDCINPGLLLASIAPQPFCVLTINLQYPFEAPDLAETRPKSPLVHPSSHRVLVDLWDQVS